jgi:hypothetical protein
MSPILAFILILIAWFVIYGLAVRELIIDIIKNKRGETYNEKGLVVRLALFIGGESLVITVYGVLSFYGFVPSSATFSMALVLFTSFFPLIALRIVQHRGFDNTNRVASSVEVSELIQEKQVRIIFFSFLLALVIWSLLRFYNLVPVSQLSFWYITPILSGMTVITFLFWLVFLMSSKPWKNR